MMNQKEPKRKPLTETPRNKEPEKKPLPPLNQEKNRR